MCGCNPIYDDVTHRLAGLAPDGGLYVPETVPKISMETLASWQSMSYTELAFNVMSHFIGVEEVAETKLRAIIEKSYATFGSQHVVPLVKVSDNLLIMEQVTTLPPSRTPPSHIHFFFFI